MYFKGINTLLLYHQYQYHFTVLLFIQQMMLESKADVIVMCNVSTVLFCFHLSFGNYINMCFGKSFRLQFMTIHSQQL